METYVCRNIPELAKFRPEFFLLLFFHGLAVSWNSQTRRIARDTFMYVHNAAKE
jgi:hypothetical protein